MKKVMICLVCGVLGTMVIQAQGKTGRDAAGKAADTTGGASGAEIVRLTDTVPKPVEDDKTVAMATVKTETPATARTETPAVKDDASDTNADNAGKDGAVKKAADGGNDEWDRRWFLSPFCKFQLQDFGLLEKNRLGYQSDANTLSVGQKGNISFAASIYKNITSRFAFSADLGFSYGHVTNKNVLISQTKSKTFNLLNASIYYHLLSARYRLQPFLVVGINNLTNDKSYTAAPMGVGVKFHTKGIMFTGQAAYGYPVNTKIAPTMVYGVGMYLPLNSKKSRKKAAEDKEAESKSTNKNDSTSKSGITNNIFITINMDSVNKAGSEDEDGASGSRRKGRRSANGRDDDGLSDDVEKLSKFDFQDFGQQDYKMDTVDGRPVIKFVVYFEFNEYALTSKAFSTVDHIIYQLRKNPALIAEVKGYTDNVGTDEYNNFLSRKRAQTVFDYLNSKGIPSDKMSSQHFGKDNPVADNKDPNTAWLNRRAEIIIHVKDK